MYAIRSYYGGVHRVHQKTLLQQVLTHDRAERKQAHIPIPRPLDEEKEEAVAPVVGRQGVLDGRKEIHRITSYNVCYTKLLRTLTTSETA